jgi:hypothetical protein
MGGPPLICGSYPKGCKPLLAGYLVFLITITLGFGEKTQNQKTWWFLLFRTPQRTSVYERTSHFVGGFLDFLKSLEIYGYIHQTGTLILSRLW